MSSHPDMVLLNVDACLGKLPPRLALENGRSATTATNTTSSHKKIEVSLCPVPPPLRSNLLVHCPELDPTDFTVVPRIVRAVEDIILLRIAITCRSSCAASPNDYDYFIYRADTKREFSLQRLSRPHPVFHDDDVGLLSRGNHFTIAALVATATLNVFDLHRFHSELGRWSYKKVSVGEPQRQFPLQIPQNCRRLLYHDTSTVITIGGSGGTMGWVDLWRGILLCDVLCDEPTLRGVPLPLPLELVSCDNGLGVELGCPKSIRGIAFVRKDDSDTQDCLKLVHLEVDATRIPGADETVPPSILMNNWAIITWSNTKMTTSWRDWHRECRLQASDITMHSQLKSELLQSGLLFKPMVGAVGCRDLHNLLVSNPSVGISAACEDIIYLIARENFLHPTSWILALDLRNNTLLGAAECGIERLPGAHAMYCPSRISKYMNPETDPGDDVKNLKSVGGSQGIIKMPEDKA